MEIKNMNEIKELVKNKKNGFPIAIWGVEKQKIKECINLLYGSVDVMPELNIITLENDRVNYDEVVNACESLPFISERKIVHIKNPYFIKKSTKPEEEGESINSSSEISILGLISVSEETARCLICGTIHPVFNHSADLACRG